MILAGLFSNYMHVKMLIYVGMAVWRFVHDESQQKFPLETGGILVGRSDSTGIFVVHAIGPGPLATHERARFLRDGEYAQQELDSYVALSRESSDYIGEWHSHPAPVGPSSRDRDSMKWISNRESYNCAEPILIICVRNRRREWSPLGCQWRASELVSIPVVVGVKLY